MKKRFLSLALYALPVIFFAISYLTMITSGEDIFQGAATPPDLFGDAVAAFRHSARLADIYAWVIINFYTYSVSLGPDLFFRLFDVFAAFSLFYLCTFFVLRRRPKLKIKDALIFSSLFLLVLLTQNGRILYSGFSGIHNYLFISLSTLLFFLPIYSLIWRKKSASLTLQSNHSNKPTNHPDEQATSSGRRAGLISTLKPLALFLLAFVFSFSSNVTAIIFLISLAFYLLLTTLLSKKFPKSFTPVNKNLRSYLFCTLPGIFLGLALIYLVGDGLSDYSTDPTYLASYDYVPFSALLSSPFLSAWKILKHIAWNFFRSLAPLALFSLPPLAYLLLSAFRINKTSKQVNVSVSASIKTFLPSLTKAQKKYLLALSIFTFTYLLSFSQLYLPTRLALPAYLTASILFLYIWRMIFKTTDKLRREAISKTTHQSFRRLCTAYGRRKELIVVSANLLLCLILIIIRTSFSLDYRSRVIPMLNRIRTSPAQEFCFSYQSTLSKDLPVLHLGQESFLVDWALPETIYGKKVAYCTE